MFNTFRAWPVSMQALPPRLQHHRILRIGITSLLTVPAWLSTGVLRESAEPRWHGWRTESGAKGRARAPTGQFSGKTDGRATALFVAVLAG